MADYPAILLATKLNRLGEQIRSSKLRQRRTHKCPNSISDTQMSLGS